MKKTLLLLTIVFSLLSLQAQTTTRKYTFADNVYKHEISSNAVKGDTLVTPYHYEDSKGVQHPIIMSSTGSCYVWRVSSKTGKRYKQYLGPEISQDICKKLGKEYNPIKK